MPKSRESVVLRRLSQISGEERPNFSLWTFEYETRDLPEGARCAACGKQIRTMTHVRHLRTNATTQLGSTCYAILERAKLGLLSPSIGAIGADESRQLRVALSSRYSDVARGGEFAGAWSTWLLSQLELPELSSQVRSGIESLKRSGWISDELQLDACIAFHDGHRRFDAIALLGHECLELGIGEREPLTVSEARLMMDLPRYSGLPAVRDVPNWDNLHPLYVLLKARKRGTSPSANFQMLLATHREELLGGSAEVAARVLSEAAHTPEPENLAWRWLTTASIDVLIETIAAAKAWTAEQASDDLRKVFGQRFWSLVPSRSARLKDKAQR
jgi:hypothetical protein